MLTEPPSPSSVLAFATTIHLGLAALRNNRRLTLSPVSSLACVSLALAALPWIFPSVVGLAFGLLAHLVWFAACEWFTPKPIVPAVKARPSPPAQPSVSSRRAPNAEATDVTRPKGFVQVPVLATFDETATIKTFRLARPEGFAFEPGQFVTVRIRVDGKEYARCYSISSAPETRGYLEISVKRHGLVSNALHAAARPGGTLGIKAPLGAFRYPSGDDRPIVLLAGGVGITPLVSMMRHAVSTEPTRPVTLLYSAHTEDDFAFKDEIIAAARRHPQLRVCLATSKGSTQPYIYPGRIDEALLRATVPDLADRVALVCGPTTMIDAVKVLLTKLGVPEGQIRSELFQAAVAAAAAVGRDDGRAARQALSAAAAGTGDRAMNPKAARAGAGERGGHRMVCEKTGRQIAVRVGQTLLEAAEEGGLAIDSMCRAGVCGTCRLQVSAGDVNCESDTLDADEQSQGFVLACVTTAETDCTVNL